MSFGCVVLFSLMIIIKNSKVQSVNVEWCDFEGDANKNSKKKLMFHVLKRDFEAGGLRH